jgi:hypothetical protein
MLRHFAMAEAPKPWAFSSRTLAASMLGGLPLYTPRALASSTP